MADLLQQDFQLTFQHSTEWPKSQEGAPSRLLILDSSFNPPTLAHHELIKCALASSEYDAILLLFSTNNADKKMTGANVQQRLEMMQCIASEDRRMAVGVTRYGKFVDKAQAILKAYDRPVQLSFILGYDTLIRLMDPKYYWPVSLVEALEPLSQCRLICAGRGEEDPAFWTRLENEFSTLSIQRISLDRNQAGLSSTLARDKARKGECLDRVLHPHIIRLVQQHGLYQEQS